METIQFSGKPQRIDKYLANKTDHSRNFLQGIIERDGILVQSPGSNRPHAIKKSHKLEEGDIIFVEDLEKFFDGGLLKESPVWDIPIIDEKKDYLIIDKPKGILSHPNSIRDIESKSVVGGVYHYLDGATLPSTGGFVRAGLVHRLDKDTDGLMIIVKTQKGMRHFKNLFKEKSLANSIEEKESIPLKKWYRARAKADSQGVKFLEETVGRNFPYYIIEKVDPKVPYSVPKQGITKIVDWKEYKKSGLYDLSLEILTGRTHQIRMHLSEKGLPILGDYLYGQESNKKLALTASKLFFEDPDGEEKTYTKEL